MGIAAAIAAGLELAGLILQRMNMNLQRKYSDPLAEAQRKFDLEMVKPYQDISTVALAELFDEINRLNRAMVNDAFKGDNK